MSMITLQNKKSGIDYFRLIAAFLVIAIHTSPLLSYTETGDFILTRIIARVAVPFFFMTSGFFLITRYRRNEHKRNLFVQKTALLYGVSILLYLPLNIYSGYFKVANLLPNILKDIFFDGTFYHLWYLPSAIIGGIIAWFLVKQCHYNYRKALLITSALYLIGLFGDSYYGITEKIPLLNGIYKCIFQVSDYTRNGIFFAPIFFVLGGMLSNKSTRVSLKNSFIGFSVSLILMIGEGMLLHIGGLQRHDSMYFFLIPCMYFLFNALTLFPGKRNVYLCKLALVLYIIHPIIIVILRLFAKITHMQALFIENSLVHYLSVSILSTIFAILTLFLFHKLDSKKKGKFIRENERAWLEIDYPNLKNNVTVLKRAMPKDCEFMAVVKSDAYGHGAFEIATYINQIGVKSFAVATIDEGIQLRRYGINDEILILGFTPATRAKELYKYDLMQTLIDYDYAVKLNKQGYNLKAHIKIDTGMHRLGFDYEDKEAIKQLFRMNHIQVLGIYTHLCASDSLIAEDVHFTKLQIKHFYSLIEGLKEDRIKIPKIHIQSSYGLLNYPELSCNYARIGIALYGVLSSPNDETKLQLDLRPVLSLKSQIVLIRQVQCGESVGYGRAYITKNACKIAVVPMGYADGVPRSLSYENGKVIINGHRAPIVGQICMDQLIIDVTGIDRVSIGDIVTLIGKDGNDELSASAIAADSGSITNELLIRMGKRFILD